MSTCRDEVLRAFDRLCRRHARQVFELQEIVQEVQAVTDRYEPSTIRAHVTSRMCVNAPANHAVVYDDVERVGRWRYRLRGGAAPARGSELRQAVRSVGRLVAADDHHFVASAATTVSATPAPESPTGRRIGLIGCVKEKRPELSAARDLYTSPLFRGRRRWVEATCDQWWILSAAHGLVGPGDPLGPYDVALKRASAAERRRWAAQVLEQFDERVRPMPGDIIEVHAGSEYRDHGLLDGLRQRGCVVENPTQGMGIGTQLSFYARGPGAHA